MPILTAMTGAALKEFTTSLLDGDEMDDTPFYTMVNIVKTMVESMRPWRKLLSKDSTLFANASDTYLTMKALPTGWIMFDQYEPIFLEAVDDGSVLDGYKASSFAAREKNKNSGPLFYTDVKNSQFGLIHDINKQYIIHVNFTEETDAITSAAGWEFPARFHPLLAYMVSGMQKGGVDYDDIFARMAPENRSQAQLLINAMEMWDDALQRQEQNV